MIALWVAACSLLSWCSSLSGVQGIGVNYGMMGSDLPSPDKVVALYKANNITDVRIFHPDTNVLEALRGSGLGVVLGTLNSDLAPLASDASYAASWVQSYVQPFAGAPSSVPLDYALLSSSAAVAVTDNGVEYANMFDAILDAVYAAVEKAGGGESLELVVSETGWPSGGGGYGASVENAAAYINNLVRHVGRGTPRRPGKAVETYIFAMFNENQKPEGVEQYFGMFQPDMSQVYHVDFSASS
uniref:Putative glucan endo-1,3-beta-glucosidase GVI n=1 Tax=Aegilops tauschii TaxID=37682 RepID=M8AH82_AEGTA